MKTTKEARHTRNACDVCGEAEPRKGLRTVRVTVDGKVVARWRLCAVCKAIKLVSLNNQKTAW